ncbi:MAG: alpha-hydroxy-acid oxidizing protein [Acidimicrobiales bacterium]
MGTLAPTWDDVAWIVKEWGGPLMLKGITRVDDARSAADAGVAAISVSTHGGNNLDGTPEPSECCRPSSTQSATTSRSCSTAASAAGDVVKALALGARAVMIGRAYLWGLAANGQAGVETSSTSCEAGSIRHSLPCASRA